MSEEKDKNLKALDDLDNTISEIINKMENLTYIGQHMANLLKEFKAELCTDHRFSNICAEAAELIWRWEKEFKRKP